MNWGSRERAMNVKLRIVLVTTLLLGTIVLSGAVIAQQGVSRDNPVPLGQPVSIGDYVISVAAVNLDATQQVLEENQLDEPPIPGNQFVIVSLEVQYGGSEIGRLTDLQFSVVGPANVGYLEDEMLDCWESSEGQNLAGDIFPGGVIQDVRCWSVPEDEVDALVMYGGLADSDQSPLFFTLDGNVPPPSPASPITPSEEIEITPAEARIELEAQDPFTWSTKVLEAAPGQVIQVTNVGFLEHNFVVDDLGIAVDLPPGEPVEITIPSDAVVGETYTFYCSVPGHREGGMVGTMTIVAPGAGDARGTADDDIARPTPEAATNNTEPDGSDAGGEAIQLEAHDPFDWSTTEIEASAGQVIQMTNAGFLEHNFTVVEYEIAVDLPPGEPVEFSIPAEAVVGDQVEFYCAVPGHREGGMVGTLTIVEAPTVVETREEDRPSNTDIATPGAASTVPDATPIGSPVAATPVLDVQNAGASGLLATGDVTRTESTTRVLWGADAEPLSGVAGFVPVSFTFLDDDAHGHPYVFIELKNVSGNATFAPHLEVDLLREDFSFGEQWVPSSKNWIEVGGSAYYQEMEFYSGALGNSDWNGLEMILSAPVVRESAEGIRVEGERLFNDRAEVLPPTLLTAAMFDSNGVFIGSCIGPETGANTPPGGSLQLSLPADPTYDPFCGFSEAGKLGSIDLGVGGPFITEYWVMMFRP